MKQTVHFQNIENPDLILPGDYCCILNYNRVWAVEILFLALFRNSKNIFNVGK